MLKRTKEGQTDFHIHEQQRGAPEREIGDAGSVFLESAIAILAKICWSRSLEWGLNEIVVEIRSCLEYRSHKLKLSPHRATLGLRSFPTLMWRHAHFVTNADHD